MHADRYTRRGITDDNMSTRRKMRLVEKTANGKFEFHQCPLKDGFRAPLFSLLVKKFVLSEPIQNFFPFRPD